MCDNKYYVSTSLGHQGVQIFGQSSFHMVFLKMFWDVILAQIGTQIE